jgi:hypothetical protein
MANSLGRSKDIPAPIQSLFVGFQPYLGGNDALWALNEMCVTDKHKMLIPVGNLVVRTGANVRGTGYFSMPDPHIWDAERNEMVLITLGPGAEFDCQFEFHMFVAVTGIRVVDGMPILKVLMEMGRSVGNVLTVLESESKRQGYLSITQQVFCLSSGCCFWCVLKADTYGLWRLGVELQAWTDGASSQMRRSIPGWNGRLRHADLTTCVMASALGYCSNSSRSGLGAGHCLAKKPYSLFSVSNSSFLISILSLFRSRRILAKRFI